MACVQVVTCADEVDEQLEDEMSCVHVVTRTDDVVEQLEHPEGEMEYTQVVELPDEVDEQLEFEIVRMRIVAHASEVDEQREVLRGQKGAEMRTSSAMRAPRVGPSIALRRTGGSFFSALI